MEYKSFLIKHGEIGVKGRNRYKSEDALVRQLGPALKSSGSAFHIVKEYGRIYVGMDGTYDYEDMIVALQRAFGVASICLVLRLMERSEDAIAVKAVYFLREITAGEVKSFKVFTRRIDKNHPSTPEEISAPLGAVLLDACPNLHVDARNPGIRLNLEIRNEGILLCALSIPDPGGMPVGTAGHAMLSLSGGIDSLVAGYMITKCGVQLEAAYPHAPPYTSERAKQKVVDLACTLAYYAGPVHLHIANFMNIQLYIYEKYPREELTIIMRRYTMRITETIAKENKGMALATGESIGQVVSQAVPSLPSTNEVCTPPVFRPLIGLDKQEIIERVEKMGSYETSILPFKDRRTIFTAKHPVTNSKLSCIKKSEERLVKRIEELMETVLRTEEIVLCEA